MPPTEKLEIGALYVLKSKGLNIEYGPYVYLGDHQNPNLQHSIEIVPIFLDVQDLNKFPLYFYRFSEYTFIRLD